jgi:hypothetical protein
MGKNSTTYSPVDTTGSVVNPYNGAMIFGVYQGIKTITVEMDSEKIGKDTASDGAVMGSYIPGDAGKVIIEVQQTSEWYKYFVDWYNLNKLAADNQDVSNTFGGAVVLRNITDGTSHLATGVAPGKLPPKVYAGSGGYVTVTLEALDVQSVTN